MSGIFIYVIGIESYCSVVIHMPSRFTLTVVVCCTGFSTAGSTTFKGTLDFTLMTGFALIDFIIAFSDEENTNCCACASIFSEILNNTEGPGISLQKPFEPTNNAITKRYFFMRENKCSQIYEFALKFNLLELLFS